MLLLILNKYIGNLISMGTCVECFTYNRYVFYHYFISHMKAHSTIEIEVDHFEKVSQQVYL